MQSQLEYFPPGTTVAELDLKSGIHARAYVRGAGKRTAIFLHGFPELAVSWRGQLAEIPGGFVFVAPDMRGYGGTSVPKKIGDYSMHKLVADVIALADAMDLKTFDLVGHDWGGAVSWEVARAFPDRVRSLAVLNCPPSDVFVRALLRPEQLFKSWYMFFFQLPFLPERFFMRGPESALQRGFRSIAVNRKIFTPEMVRPYAENLRANGPAGINYYRANTTFSRPAPPLITCPVRLIWGLGDGALGPWFSDAKLYEKVAKNFSVVPIEGAGHWVQQEATAVVNEALKSFWASVPT